MQTIFTTIYGSHLFGCAIPGSDTDFKGVHLENLRELLFKDVHAENEKIETAEKKIESESYSLRFYLKMLAQGQVIATDMFFAPEKYWRGYDPIWGDLKELKPHIITRNIGAFAGYAKTQSYKYGVKGLKINTLVKTIALLEANVSFDTLVEELTGMEGFETRIEEAPGGPIRHVVICGKSFGETTSYKLWIPPLRKFEAAYGSRARASKTGLDLKAQYHTVRICCEAVELLTTGFITFPRPEADLLLKIRKEELTDDALRELVDSKLVELQETKPIDSLAEDVNWPKIEDFIYNAERKHIVKSS